MNYLTLVVALAILLSFTNGAPTQMRRHRRHWPSMHDDPFHPNKIPWMNSCGTSPKNDTLNDHRKTAKPLKGLRNQLPNFSIRLNSQRAQAIDTDDVSQWFSQPFNSTYSFLAQINGSTSNIHLRKRHIETQVYVGAFQYLRWKQLRHDTIRNENINKTRALEYLLILAKNLLCEIETAINHTGMKMPMILSKEVMHSRLTFRNNNRVRKMTADDVDEVDEIDSKFTKIRFSEYLQGLEQVLKNRMGKQHHHVEKKKPRRKQQQQPKKRMGVGAVLPKLNQPIDDNSHHLRDNHIDSSIALTKRHRNAGLKHRNPFGPYKQNRNRKPVRKGVASMRPNEINMFRSHRKIIQTKLTAEPTNLLRSSTITPTTTSTTTVAPQV